MARRSWRSPAMEGSSGDRGRCEGTGVSGADLFRPRRRPLLRLVLVLAGAAVVLCTAAIITWLRFNVVPPDCSDPRTLALVRQSLLGRFKLPPAVTIDTIR